MSNKIYLRNLMKYGNDMQSELKAYKVNMKNGRDGFYLEV